MKTIWKYAERYDIIIVYTSITIAGVACVLYDLTEEKIWRSVLNFRYLP